MSCRFRFTLILASLWAALIVAGQQPSPAASAAPPPAQPALAQPPAPAASTPTPLSLADAQAAALQQVSALRQAEYDEAIAAEDLRQARAALLPRVRDEYTVTYNSPERGSVPAVPSFIAADAIHQYQNLTGVAGELHAGMLAGVHRARALLDAARAGTAVARRALFRGVTDSYYGAALARAKRAAAEQSFTAAEEFERVTRLNYEGGEVPEVDWIRARLQTAARRDELLQAREAEAVADAGLGVLLGMSGAPDIDALPQTVDANAVGAFAAEGVARRPELMQASAEAQAARYGVGVARGDILPRITYSVDRGFDSDTLMHDELRRHRGTLATALIDIPLFDWGITFSRIRQAQLQAKAAEAQRELTSRGLFIEYATARQEALTAAARIENARGALADAERNVAISIARYRAGEAPISEATDAQTTRAQQRLALQQALFDYQIAIAHLREAAGE